MRLYRRDVALASVATGAVAISGAPLIGETARPSWRFLTSSEADFVEAAADRILPADEHSPGGKAAGVGSFIDGQLAGPWGNGAGLYGSEPHSPGTPQQGYQLPFTPAQLYRAAILALELRVSEEHGGRRFAQLGPETQDAVLSALEAGRIDVAPADSRAFFALLRANCVEGYFADPLHGGNRDMAGWKMLGFPGAYAAYWFEVEDHGFAYERPPASIAMVQEACRALPGQPAAEAARGQQPTATGSRR